MGDLNIEDIDIKRYRPKDGDVFLITFKSSDPENIPVKEIKEKFQFLFKDSKIDCKVVCFAVNPEDSIDFAVVNKTGQEIE